MPHWTHDFDAPDSPCSYIANIKVATDKTTSLVGQLTFVVKANDTKLPLPSTIVSCGTQGGLSFSAVPPLGAVSSVSGSCVGAGLSGLAIDPASFAPTVTTVGAPGTPVPVPVPGPCDGASVLLCNLVSPISSLTVGAFGSGGIDNFGYQFTTGAAASTVNTVTIPLSSTAGAASCVASITTLNNQNLPVAPVAGSSSVTQTVTSPTALVTFTGFAAALAPNTKYGVIFICSGPLVDWYGDPALTPTGAPTVGPYSSTGDRLLSAAGTPSSFTALVPWVPEGLQVKMLST